jgi:hypothetical protein
MSVVLFTVLHIIFIPCYIFLSLLEDLMRYPHNLIFLVIVTTALFSYGVCVSISTLVNKYAHVIRIMQLLSIP